MFAAKACTERSRRAVPTTTIKNPSRPLRLRAFALDLNLLRGILFFAAAGLEAGRGLAIIAFIEEKTQHVFFNEFYIFRVGRI